jgi:hypothetical protein
MDRIVRWFEMPVSVQLANVGSEVNRAIKYKNKNEEQKKINFTQKAIELLDLTIEDPKNVNRREELECCKEELNDFFLGSNDYHTTDDILIRFYDSFLYRQ